MDKEQRRQAKALHRLTKHGAPVEESAYFKSGTIDCACVIHGTQYPWEYVDRLYNMLNRHLNGNIRLHVFTEHDRPVPAHMIKHVLEDWPSAAGRKKAWWYKMQMFNSAHFQGNLLYLDLDVVITGELEWIRSLSPKYFWTLHDFRRLWRPNWRGINSSMMWWDTVRFSWIWDRFSEQNLDYLMRIHPGDQDFLTAELGDRHVRFMPQNYIKSWRWEVLDGGMEMKNRIYRRPNAGALIDPQTRVIIFHGYPKPHEVTDPLIQQHRNI